MSNELNPCPTGRPSLVNDTNITTRLLYAVSLGCPYELACDYAGVDYTTLRQWVRKASEGNPLYLNFVNELKKAKGQACIGWLKSIDDSIEKGVWQAAAWKLERRHYKHFSSKAEVIQLAREIAKLGDQNETDSESTEEDFDE